MEELIKLLGLLKGGNGNVVNRCEAGSGVEKVSDVGKRAVLLFFRFQPRGTRGCHASISIPCTIDRANDYTLVIFPWL
jgi:hypothetical protein